MQLDPKQIFDLVVYDHNIWDSDKITKDELDIIEIRKIYKPHDGVRYSVDYYVEGKADLFNANITQDIYQKMRNSKIDSIIKNRV